MSLYEAKPAISKELQEGKEEEERDRNSSEVYIEKERGNGEKEEESWVRDSTRCLTHSFYCSLALSKRDRSHIIMPLSLFLCALYSAGEES